MPVSWVDIANMALGRIGTSSRVTDLTASDKASVTMNATMPTTAQSVLEGWDWKSVSTRTQLTKDATPPVFGFKNRYLLPADPYCLVVREFRPHSYDWATEGRYLLSNADSSQQPVFIRYTSFPTDPGVLTALCAKAIAWRLAAETCNVFVQGNSQTGQTAIMREYQMVIEEAQGANQWLDRNHDEDAPYLLDALFRGHGSMRGLELSSGESWVFGGSNQNTW